MTLLPPGVKVHLALGFTDMRKGIDGLAMLVSQQRARFLPILVGEPTGFERLPGAPQSSPELRASHGIALDELEQESARSKPRR